MFKIVEFNKNGFQTRHYCDTLEFAQMVLAATEKAYPEKLFLLVVPVEKV